MGITVESGYGQLLLEFGILGPIVWLFWTSSLLYTAFRVVMKVRGTWAFPVALAILWFIFYLLFPRTYGGIVGYQDFVLNAYLWLLVGVLFRLPALVANEQTSQPAVEPLRIVAPRWQSLRAAATNRA